MVVKREVITERLKQLDMALQELRSHRDVSWESFSAQLSQQWIIERGLIACAAIIFDIADHILTGHFGLYSASYEDSLTGLQQNGVITDELYQQIRGLGGFRNILVHCYLDIDPHETFANFQRSLIVFPQFATQILDWLDTVDRSDNSE